LRALSGQVRFSVFSPLYFTGLLSRRIFLDAPRWLLRPRFSS